MATFKIPKHCARYLSVIVALYCTDALAENLSIGAGSDGSSKASGTSYGNVRDGDLSTYWSPTSSTGRISIKWGSNTTVGSIVIQEASGFEGNIGAWNVVNHDTGDVLATGSGSGSISFTPVALRKINFVINSSSGTPAVAEFETYADGSGTTPPPAGQVSLSTSVTGSTVALNWTTENIANVSTVEVFRDTDNNPTGRVSVATNVSGTSYTDSSLANGTYYYWVKITDDQGNSVESSPVTATVNVEQPDLPSVSLNASAAGTNVDLSWSVTAINVANQSVYRDTDANPSGSTLIASNVSGSQFTDTNVAPGTYYYWVDVADASGGTYRSEAATAIVSAPGDANCAALVNDDSVNWYDSALQSDQEIVACLSESLGKPVGFGGKTTGGYDADGNSNLVVITKGGSVSPEQQILDAISSASPNWIVFDKEDFANDTTLAMYRNGCSNPDVLEALDNATEAECRDHTLWCSNHGVSSANCNSTFFNDRINDKSLNALKIPLINSNTTIDGRGAKVTFLFSGFKIGSDSSGASTHVSENVIITNNRFIGAGHDEDHNLDPDMIRSTGESHDIWIHQNTFEETGDSAFDVKVGAYDITVSFNRLHNVKRAALHGSSDSRTINSQITTTIHNNLFVTTDDVYGSSTYNTLRRVPLMRRGQSHMFNNVFYGYRKDILSVRVGGRIAFDNNMVLNNINNSKGDDLQDWVEVLLRDFREGGLEVTGSYVWYADSACQLQGQPGDLTASHGVTPNMVASYDSASQATYNSYRFAAGTDLADYVFATAGKGALAPYVSPDSLGVSTLIGLAPGSCQ
ncbi:pectate lyase family protein [Alteromonas sp. a30]|uniref:pectate lyase family protein n=1 Tax=Alteromonas sp. a30 TaxID=2730917 RepID=UPI00227F0947|nr:hypothetical protein [Alteromonas sp. a30]MCY7294942.1 pectate lyase [Alteromonas sp. a30]